MDIDTCVVKIGERNAPCGEAVEYRSACENGPLYSGWYHRDRESMNHHAVPKRLVS